MQKPVYEEFLQRFVARTREPVVGDPFTNGSKGIWRIAKEEGEILTGGGRPAGLDRGYCLGPTIITGVNDQCRVVREEIFGPVLCPPFFDGGRSEPMMPAAA